MKIERLWVDNPLRNYNYFIVCEQSGQAASVDPLDAGQCLEFAESLDLSITHIINTHEHGDHTAGNNGVRKGTGARVLAPRGVAGYLDHTDQVIAGGESISIGESVSLEVLDTPGHTMCHISLFINDPEPHLVCGDTVFNAGAGNVHNGGNVDALYDTFAAVIAGLPANTRIYPGHDYLVNNLAFSLDREPGNAAAARLLETESAVAPDNRVVTTLEQERQINAFMRLTEQQVIDGVSGRIPDPGEALGARQVFTALRMLRNKW